MRVFAALVAALTVCALVTPDLRASRRSLASAQPKAVPVFWQRVAQCETGSRWNWGAGHRPGEGRLYEGGVGFAASTWRLWAGELGLLGRYPHAYQAPSAVQVRVAQFGLEHGGYWGALHNGCAG